MRTKPLLSRYRVLVAPLAALSMIAATVVATPALAANPPIAIVGPAEWDLPTVPSANVFMQTGVFQDSTNTYNASGQEVSTASSQTYEGISRWAHLFSFKSTPNTGFFWEYLQPEVMCNCQTIKVHLGLMTRCSTLASIATLQSRSQSACSRSCRFRLDSSK